MPDRTSPLTTRDWAFAVSLVLAPLLVAGCRLLFSPPPGALGWLTEAAAAPAKLTGDIALGMLACLVFPLAVIAAGRLAWSPAPRLAASGAVLSLLGWGTGPLWVGQDTLTAVLAQQGQGPDQARVWTAFDSAWPVRACLVVFVVGHLLGPALLAAAWWRAGVTSAWPMVLVAATIPLHVLAALHVLPSAVDPAGYAVLAAASLPAALVTLHSSRHPAEPTTPDVGAGGTDPRRRVTAGASGPATGAG